MGIVVVYVAGPVQSQKTIGCSLLLSVLLLRWAKPTAQWQWQDVPLIPLARLARLAQSTGT
jgi:hypothetical protein